MEHQMPIKYDLKHVEIIYKAEFSPPLLEIALPQYQAQLLKLLCKEFDLKFRDFVFNNQAISSGLIYFRRFITHAPEFFDALIGADELKTSYVNPATKTKAWEPTLRLMDSLSRLGQLNLKTQTLTFNLHCLAATKTYSDFINDIVTFKKKADIIISRGATFFFQLPWPGCNLNMIFDRSMIVENGLFMQIHANFAESVQEYQTLFTDIVYILKENIEPIFNIQLIYKEK
ncbi:MAG: hypothetical protein ACLFUU_02020 [Desulfobacteraceae bacterium]